MIKEWYIGNKRITGNEAEMYLESRNKAFIETKEELVSTLKEIINNLEECEIDETNEFTAYASNVLQLGEALGCATSSIEVILDSLNTLI